jgi:hypothetical protein
MCIVSVQHFWSDYSLLNTSGSSTKVRNLTLVQLQTASAKTDHVRKWKKTYMLSTGRSLTLASSTIDGHNASSLDCCQGLRDRECGNTWARKIHQETTPSFFPASSDEMYLATQSFINSGKGQTYGRQESKITRVGLAGSGMSEYV